MTDIFVPCILNNSVPFLFKVDFEFDKICSKGKANNYWEIPDIHHCEKDPAPDFKELYRKVESYFSGTFINAEKSAMVYFRPIDENILKGCEFELNYGNISVLLGIFLAAAKKILKLKIKKRWLSIAATGTFEYDQKSILLLEKISNYKNKFLAFKDYVQNYIKENGHEFGKYHLFLYVNNDKSLEEMSSEDICVKSFSPSENTLFDILDYVFDDLPFLPKGLIDEKKEQESFFLDFEEKTRHLKKEKIIESSIYHKKKYADILTKKSLFIHGLNGTGKSFFAAQLVRRLVWDRKAYAPIWINFNNEYQIDINIEQDYFRYGNIGNVSYLPGEIKNELLKISSKNGETIDEEICLEKINQEHYLIIIDGIDLSKYQLDNFLERIETFRAGIKEGGSRIIFTNVAKPDKLDLSNIETIAMPSFDKNALINYFHEISKEKYYYLDKKRQMDEAHNYNTNISDLNYFEDLLYKNVGNLPNTLELISNQLFLYAASSYEKLIASMITGRITEMIAHIYKNAYDLLDNDSKWVLLYLLNYNPDEAIPFEKLFRDSYINIDININKQKGPEDYGKLEDHSKLMFILDDEEKMYKIKNELIDKKFLAYPLFTWDKLAYKTLLFNGYSFTDNLWERLVSKKKILSSLINKLINDIVPEEQKKDLEFIVELFGKDLHKIKLNHGCNIYHAISFNCTDIKIFEYLYEKCPESFSYSDGNKIKPVVDDRGRTALHCAASRNQSPEVLEWLIRKAEECRIDGYLHYETKIEKLDNVRTDGLCIPLHLAAAENQNPKVLDILIKNDELIADNINRQDSMLRTPLMRSLLGNPNPKIAELLIKGFINKRGIEVKSDMELRAVKKINLLHLCAVSREHTGKKITLIRKYAGEVLFNEFLNQQDDIGHIPLHYAAAYASDFSVIKMLMCSISDINREDSKGYAPLHFAVQKNTREVVEFLITMGADVNKSNNIGYTPLHIAAYQGKYDIAVMLKISGADLNNTDTNGLTPLHRAITGKNLPVFIDLLATPQNINAQTQEGFTPLHIAAFTGQYDTSVLLKKEGADLNCTDINGLTPLHAAIGMGYGVDFFDLLVTPDNVFEGTNKGFLAPIVILIINRKLYKKTDFLLLKKKCKIVMLAEMNDIIKDPSTGHSIKSFYKLMRFLYKFI